MAYDIMSNVRFEDSLKFINMYNKKKETEFGVTDIGKLFAGFVKFSGVDRYRTPKY